MYKMRFAAYAGVSTALAMSTVTLAFIERPNFYSACVSISQSSVSLLVLVNMVLVVALLVGRVVQLLFFGQLRALELENLYERSWYALTETFLAMTIFRDDFNFEFASYFIMLTFVKVFHWICADRVDLIFQSVQSPSTFSKVRLWTALGLFLALDVVCVKGCATQLFINGPGVMVMFAFEFALLLNSMVSCIGKYVLNQLEERYLNENEDEDRWEKKGVFMFGLEVLSDLSRLLIYISFFIVMLKPYGPPIHVMRDVYMTAASFIGRIKDFIQFRRARKQMDNVIADATPEDVLQETVCIVCREDMLVEPGQAQRYVPKKLACGHVIHYGCLKSWLERSQRCPTCRGPVIAGDDNEGGGWTRRAAAVNNNQAPQDANNNNDNQPQHMPTPTENNETAAATRILDSRTMRAVPSDSLVVNTPGFRLPTGWTALKAKRSENGRYQIQLNNDTWATVESSDTADNDGASTSHSATSNSSLFKGTEEQQQQYQTLKDSIESIQSRLVTLEAVQDRMERTVSRLENLCKQFDREHEVYE